MDIGHDTFNKIVGHEILLQFIAELVHTLVHAVFSLNLQISKKLLTEMFGRYTRPAHMSTTNARAL